jgi:hypothetical protein
MAKGPKGGAAKATAPAPAQTAEGLRGGAAGLGEESEVPAVKFIHIAKMEEWEVVG